MQKGKQFLLFTARTSPAVSPRESSHWEHKSRVFEEGNGCIFQSERHKRLSHTTNDRPVQLRITPNLPFCRFPSFLAAVLPFIPTPHCNYHTPKSNLQSLHRASFAVVSGNILTSHVLTRRECLILLADCSHNWQAAQCIWK